MSSPSSVSSSSAVRPRILPWTIAFSLAGIAVFLGLAAVGWPGFVPNGCRVAPDAMRPTCFCEVAHPGWIAQPANTASNLGFVAVGLAIAWATDRRRRRDERPANPVTRSAFYPGVFAVTIALLGPGSMFLHGSLTREGGTLDVASMYLFSGLLIAYAATRAWELSRTTFSVAFALLFGVPILLRITIDLWVEPTFALLLATFAGVELYGRRRRPELWRDVRFLLAAVALFGLAFALWVPSLSGGPLCDPQSPLQGHAAWHLLDALAAGSLFLYFASERNIAAPGAGTGTPAGRRAR